MKRVFGRLLLLLIPFTSFGQEVRTAAFDLDPRWEGFRNRLLPERLPITRQDFGRFPDGSVGGRAQRSLTPATFALPIEKRGLNDTLRASGTFSVSKAEGGSGLLFGWFRRDSQGWRTPNSLAFRIDGNGGKYWILFEYGTSGLKTGGGTTFEGRYQTTSTKPFPADGSPHAWSLEYDPNGEGGRGRIRFEIDGRAYFTTLGEGHRAEGAEFDRFGMFNQQTSGDAIEACFSDLKLDGVSIASRTDWIGVGNRSTFADRAFRPFQDFGFSPTAHAGGALGEIGGIVWRDEAPSYYGDRVGPLSLDDELSASGRLTLKRAGSDSGVYIGWFSSDERSRTVPEHVSPRKNLLGLHIEGPSRVGHYVRPAVRNREGSGAEVEDGPLLRPDGKTREWSLRYNPATRRIRMTFDGEVREISVPERERRVGARFDRFGILTRASGGHHVELYLDDLRYTATSVFQGR